MLACSVRALVTAWMTTNLPAISRTAWYCCLCYFLFKSLIPSIFNCLSIV